MQTGIWSQLSFLPRDLLKNDMSILHSNIPFSDQVCLPKSPKGAKKQNQNTTRIAGLNSGPYQPTSTVPAFIIRLVQRIGDLSCLVSVIFTPFVRFEKLLSKGRKIIVAQLGPAIRVSRLPLSYRTTKPIFNNVHCFIKFVAKSTPEQWRNQRYISFLYPRQNTHYKIY